MSEGRIIPPGEVLSPMDAPPKKAEADGTKPSKTKGRKTGDRFAVLNSFVDCSMADLSRAELATWLVLYRDTRNGTACTSVDDIGRRAGISKRRTIEAIGKLCRLGLLTRVYRGGLNRGPSLYRVYPMLREP